MSRRRAAKSERLLPDAKYGHLVVAKLINVIMLAGKKSVAERIAYNAMEGASEKLGISPADVLEKAVANVTPLIEVCSRRVGGATYQVPTEVRPERRLALALRWIVRAAHSRKAERTMIRKLAAELVDACNERGAAVKKREDVHKTAEGNRAFTHYRW